MALDLKKEQFVPVLVVLMFFWALMHPLSKMIVGSVSPALMALLRNVLGSVALLAMIGWKGRDLKVRKGDIVPLLLLGVVGIAFSSLMLFMGLGLSTATNASILVNTNPLFVALLAPFLIGERLERKQLVGVAIAFVGMVLVTTNGMGIAELMSSDFFLGNLALIASAIGIMLYTIYGKRYVKKYGGMVATLYTVAAGAAVLLLYAAATGELAGVMNITLEEWLVLMYVGFVVTAFVYAVWYKSIKFIGAARASSFKLLIPVFATITSIILIGEAPGMFVIGGGILVVAGLAVMQKIF